MEYVVSVHIWHVISKYIPVWNTHPKMNTENEKEIWCGLRSTENKFVSAKIRKDVEN